MHTHILMYRAYGVYYPEGMEAFWVKVTPFNHSRHTISTIYCVAQHPTLAPSAQVLVKNIHDIADTLRVRFPADKLVVCGDLNIFDV